MTMYHVATTGHDTDPGTANRPFRTINRAAALAQAGDTITVHAGVYREWVTPRRGGRSDQRRITFAAAPGEHVVIKGSERVTDWQRESGDVWQTTVPNALFGDFNPFAREVAGDWLVRPTAARVHLGEVYLDGTSLYEVTDKASLADPPLATTVTDDWTGRPDPVRDPDATRRVWYAEVGAEATTIWANFGGLDPTDRLTEINVRRSVFYPQEHHLDYITVRGFELAQAACPWAPPTADQPGLIGPNWAKGWIIEDCDIHDAKCSAISLGKEASTGDGYAAERRDKPGYQYQLESVFAARQIGWDAEHIGGHIVRRNTIHDCGQNGVVGHLGCVFSTIEDNHIFNIAIKRQFYGHEIAGIKLHAAIDVVIRGNHLHDCSLGVWLDWQAQGTRVTRNILHSNNRDLFVEVSHGPYLVDHNILASPVALESFSEGGAFVNNLIAGSLWVKPVMDRATPYHRPHSTQVAGYAVIYGGDDRFTGNLFLGRPEPGYADTRVVSGYGTTVFDGHPASYAAYQALVDAGTGDLERFLTVRQPVYIHSNTYAAGAAPYEGERDATILEGEASVRVTVDTDGVWLDASLPPGFATATAPAVSGADLPRVRFADAEFEDPDGHPARLGTDLVGAPKTVGTAYPAGPLVSLTPGVTRTRLL
ncbi:MAG: right-handed parallel beta-helix repeat-containing protein [Propionibacteriaceae bacterium]|jgi:hypothetical protein|nr:right-handed parallel beta-helix repeat-containing protein [Propionibacteriaceae bacterium]